MKVILIQEDNEKDKVVLGLAKKLNLNILDIEADELEIEQEVDEDTPVEEKQSVPAPNGCGFALVKVSPESDPPYQVSLDNTVSKHKTLKTAFFKFKQTQNTCVYEWSPELGMYIPLSEDNLNKYSILTMG